MAAKNDKVGGNGNSAGTAGPAHRPHVVVLGAGFGGLAFARNFPDGLARISIVDRANHHLFQPLLYQVAAAGLAVPDIAQPVRSILAKKRDVTVLMDEITAIEPRRPVFHYCDKGAMATIGRSRAVARIGRFEFAGAFAWLLWLVVHLLFLIGFRNKLSVLLQWAHSYLTYKPGARVIYALPNSARTGRLEIERTLPSVHSLS
jgi:NADH dehydrogenase FAD-containing subunit